MARNEEKQLGRLNRMLLKKQHDEEREKNPPRPKLSTLQTANDVKKWLPTIKRDIDFCLKQSQVTCYPERKIEEYSQKIDYLQREYRAFIRKLRALDPKSEVLPWTERGYSARKSKVQDRPQEQPISRIEFIETPTLIDSNSDESESIEITPKHLRCGLSPTNIEVDLQDQFPKAKGSPVQESVYRCIKDISTESSSKTATCGLGPDVLKKEHYANPLKQTETFKSKIQTVIETPLLKNKNFTSLYGYQSPSTVVYNANVELQDVPLNFTTPDCTASIKFQQTGDEKLSVMGSEVFPNWNKKNFNENISSDHINIVDNDSQSVKSNLLCIPYSDSSDSNDDTEQNAT
ncbi:hypothetical protein ScPMuIL_007163 [Solemya velum]